MTAPARLPEPDPVPQADPELVAYRSRLDRLGGWLADLSWLVVLCFVVGSLVW